MSTQAELALKLDEFLTTPGSLLSSDGTNFSVLVPGSNTQILTLVAGLPTWQTPAIPSTVVDFLDLTDAPGSYSGAAQKFVKVKADESGLEFVAGADVVAAWGSITGTLSAQTDLQAALSGKQPIDATLTALAGVTTVADRLIYATGADTFTTTTLTSFARSLLDDISASTARATLGLTSLATQNILGGAGITATLDGANLTIASTIPSYTANAALNALAGVTPTADAISYFTSGSAAGITSLTPFARTLLDDVDASGALATLLSGTGVRIPLNSSATNLVDRTFFSSHAVNSNTIVGAIPNGTATASVFRAYNKSDPTNSSWLGLQAFSTYTELRSGTAGTGAYLPLRFVVGGAEVGTWDIDGTLNVTKLRVDGNSVAASSLISVKAYGAVGDGVTDDTAAIQAAINACIAFKKSLYVPAGTYMVTGLAYVSGDQTQINIYGDGRNKSKIKKLSGVSPILTVGNDGEFFHSNYSIRDITFDGAGLSVVCLRLYNVARASIYSCAVTQGHVGLDIIGAVALQVYDTVASWCNTGVKAGGVMSAAGGNEYSWANFVMFNGCQLVSNSMYGVYYEGGQLIIFDSCNIEGNGYDSGYPFGSAGVYLARHPYFDSHNYYNLGGVFQNCWFEANNISVMNYDYKVVVENSTFIANNVVQPDIYIGSGNYTVRDCVFDQNKTYLYHVVEENVAGVKHGNMIYGNTGLATPQFFYNADKTLVNFANVQSGTVATDGSGVASVTFPTAFASTPNIVLTCYDGGTDFWSVKLTAVSNTSFSVLSQILVAGVPTPSAINVHWQASKR